ncbi:MAG: hypothetical protein ABIZ70_04605 [Gemmatimonadales bacterium]
MPDPTDIGDLLRSIDSRLQAREARRASGRALGVSIAIHLTLLAGLIYAASRARPPKPVWTDTSLADQPAQVAGVPASAGINNPQLAACADFSDSLGREILKYVKRAVEGVTVSNSGFATLPRSDSNLVRVVRADSLCRRAVRAIDRSYSDVGDHARTIYLVRTANAHFALDTNVVSGRRGKSFAMDTDLTRILAW